MTSFLSILFDASIRISLAAFAVGTVLFLGRVRSSSLRHKAWLGVLCAMFAMPILMQVLPRVDIFIPQPTDLTPAQALPSSPPGGVDSDPRADRGGQSGGVSASNLHPLGGRTPTWSEYILAVYAAGVALFLTRLLAGWLSAQRLVKAGSRITISGKVAYESSDIATPMTVGLRIPKILLPAGWNQWPEENLNAVLAHESWHVRRYDTVTNFLAYLNRCLFWFHPLSWWLQRQLALAAEEECDRAAVIVMGGTQEYAHILLEMAALGRLKPRPFATQSVGVDGLLDARIGRILRGDVFSVATPVQRWLMATTFCGAVFVSAACRQNAAYKVALRPDPQNSVLLARQKADREFNQAASRMSAAEAASLEDFLRRNPQDMDARRKLMIFYQTSGRKVLGDEKTIAGFWTQRLWCIQYHPENLCASLIEPLSDPAAYRQAARLWLVAARRNDASPGALLGAATFFQKTNPQLAEEIVQRTNFPAAGRADWLGRIYADALTGGAAQTPYALEVRKKLTDTKDPVLLAATGYRLAAFQSNDAETRNLGRSYLERALALDPNSAESREALTRIQRNGFYSELNRDANDTVGRETSEAQYAKASELSVAQRVRFLPYLAQRAYLTGDSLDYYKHDHAGARKAWELARRYATDALQLPVTSTNDQDKDNLIYTSHMTLGMVAMRVDGNSKAARNELLAASTVKTAGGNITPFTTHLPVLLLRYGNSDDRQAVIQYLERYGRVLNRRDLDLLLAARQLRQGIMPIWYQYQAAQLK